MTPARAIRRPVLAAALLLPAAALLTACGGSSSSGSTTTTSSSARTSSAPPTSAATTSAAPTAGSADLSSLLPAAPAGYSPSNGSDDDNGPISASTFDDETTTGEATKLSYQGGDAVTYADAHDDEVEYDVLRFATAADAASFLADAKANDGTDGTDPSVTTDAAIPGSVVVSPTKDDPSGDQAEYDLFAAGSGGLAIVVSYYANDVTPSATATLESLSTAAFAKV